ncbi:MAG: hypothetical protein O6952_03620, partial [Planctomycetota bacterium]|nr:hypothetical protein [Planctomycetota bacterium]
VEEGEIMQTWIKTTSLWALLLGVGAIGGEAEAIDKISEEVRDGAAYEEFFEIGDAQVADSRVFRYGVHLAAHDLPLAEEPSLAAAIYFFEIPWEAEFVRVRVVYEDRGVRQAPYAGYLWVRDSRIEEEYLAGEDDSDETGFFGQTFLLDRGRTEEIFWLDAEPVRIEGWLEMHVAAASGNVLDVEFIQVSTHRYPPIRYYPSFIPWVPPEKSACSSFGYFYAGPWCHRTRGARYRIWNACPREKWIGWSRYRGAFRKRYAPVSRPGKYEPVTGRASRNLLLPFLVARVSSSGEKIPRLDAIGSIKRRIAGMVRADRTSPPSVVAHRPSTRVNPRVFPAAGTSGIGRPTAPRPTEIRRAFRVISRPTPAARPSTLRPPAPVQRRSFQPSPAPARRAASAPRGSAARRPSAARPRPSPQGRPARSPAPRAREISRSPTAR